MDEYSEFYAAEKQSLQYTLEILSETLKRKHKGRVELIAIAALLSNIYNGIENIIKHSLKRYGIHILKSEFWHKELIQKAVDQKIINPDLAENLRKYLRFRHFFIHGYGFMLDAERLIPIAKEAPQILSDFFEQIEKIFSSK